MGEVKQPENSENEAVADCNEGVGAPQHQPVYELLKENIDHVS
jgi:hypothetical protein